MKSAIALIPLILLLLPDNSLAQNVDLDKKIGAENAQMVVAQMGIYEHPELTPYVQEIGRRLVGQLDKQLFDYQFHIVDDPVPNAFALPGGYIYVTRGVLSLMTTEDELACVIGHEIIHSHKRHSVKQSRKGILPGILQIPGKIVGAVISPDLGNLINAPIAAGNALFLASYSRKHERESDKLGVALAAKAGYEPTAMSDILTRISEAVEALTNEEEKKNYFSSHPYTPDRVEDINDKWAPDLVWDKGEPVAMNFPEPMDGLLFGDNPAQGIFNENQFLHPDLDLHVTFPADWVTNNNAENVAAIHPAGTAALIMGLEDTTKTADEWGKEFSTNFRKQYGRPPDRSEPMELNGNSGFLVSLIDQSGGQRMYIHILWMSIGSNMVKLIGLLPQSEERSFEVAANSMRALTPDERSSIMKSLIKIVESRDEESIDQLSLRYSNTLKATQTALINGLEEANLSLGQKVKIVIEENY